MTTEITFPGFLPGNNGAKGLLRMGWRKRNKLRDTYVWWVRSKTKNRHPGPVRIRLVRYSVGIQMDWDNLVSTGKIPIDSLVLAGVIVDDKPVIIQIREYEQVKAASKKEQKTVILIEDI